MDYLLKNTLEVDKLEMAGIGVMLGLMPTIIAKSGSSLD